MIKVENIISTIELNIKKFLTEANLSLNGHSLRYLKELKYWQWLDYNHCLSLQEDRLKYLFLHAYNHVPYYRETLSKCSAIDSTGEVNLNYFKRIPLLDKAKIRSNSEYLKSDDLSLESGIEIRLVALQVNQ
mgnify:CR=1 FL=1